MNRLMVKGNIGTDAVAHAISEHRYAISFNLAVNKSYKDASGEKKTVTTWFRCVRFTQNDKLVQYLKKGLEIILIGEAGADAYVKDGVAIASPTMNIKEIEWIQTSASPKIPYHVQNTIQNDPTINNQSQAANQEVQERLSEITDDLPF